MLNTVTWVDDLETQTVQRGGNSGSGPRNEPWVDETQTVLRRGRRDGFTVTVSVMQSRLGGCASGSESESAAARGAIMIASS